MKIIGKEETLTASAGVKAASPRAPAERVPEAQNGHTESPDGPRSVNEPHTADQGASEGRWNAAVLGRTCELCGDRFTPHSPLRRFCSNRCRRRQWGLRHGQGAPGRPTMAVRGPVEQARVADPPELPEAAPPVSSVRGPQETRVRERLEAAGRLDTWQGQGAVLLAFRLDNSQGETLSGIAAGLKALREVMSAALSSGAHPAPAADGSGSSAQPAAVASVDPLQAARAKREARRVDVGGGSR